MRSEERPEIPVPIKILTPSEYLHPPVKHRYWLHLLLFVLTVLSTMMVGASLVGVDFGAILGQPSLLWAGAPYSFALLAILTCHEMGHYLAAKHHNIRVTLPFYIPLPIPYIFHFGTMGAFIRIKSPIPNRRALMDVAVAGPIAGFIVSLAFLFYGYLTLPDLPGIIAQVEKIHPWQTVPTGDALTFGESLLFYFFNHVVAPYPLPVNFMSEVYHFPFLCAGWIGLLITAINLIPIGQLDGGHTIYALFGPRAVRVSKIAYGMIGVLTAFLIWQFQANGGQWILWMIILALIGLRHPPTLNDELEIHPSQRYLGWICILIFFLCFIPLPIYFA